MVENHANAHQFWDTQWADPEARKSWEVPEERVLRTLADLGGKKDPQPITALDLGCGAGRHLLPMAKLGWTVSGCDASPTSVELVVEKLKQEQLAGGLLLAPMTALPYEPREFDYILSWNVLYHGRYDDLVKALGEVRRTLKVGGVFEATFISQRNSQFGLGQQLDSRTWINPDQGDKSHAHCYLDEADLATLLDGFKLLQQEEYEQKNYQGAWHWYVKARKGTK